MNRLLILLCIGCCNLLQAQVPELFPYLLKGKYGYINALNNERIQFVFDEARPFSEGKAYVESDKWKGYIRLNGTWAYYDTVLTDGGPMRKGVAIVKQPKGNGVIDSTGKIIVPFDYNYIQRFDELNVLIAHKEIANRKIIHLYNFKGLKVPVDFDKVVSQPEACALGLKQHDKLWVYGKDGIPLLNYPVENIFAQKYGAKISVNGLFGVINRYGKLVLPPLYKRVWVSEWAPYASFHNVAGDTSAYMNIDNGKIAFTFLGIITHPVSDNVAIISYINNVHNVHDLNGNRITQLVTYEDTAIENQRQYLESIQDLRYTDGLVAIRHPDKKWYAYNKQGRKAFANGYDANFFFENGVAIVRTNGYTFEYGLIDKTGKEILPLKYRIMLRTGEPNVLIVTDQDNKSGLFYTDGRQLYPFAHRRIREFHDGFFLITGGFEEKYKVYGYINSRTGLVYFNQNATP